MSHLKHVKAFHSDYFTTRFKSVDNKCINNERSQRSFTGSDVCSVTIDGMCCNVFFFASFCVFHFKKTDLLVEYLYFATKLYFLI